MTTVPCTICAAPVSHATGRWRTIDGRLHEHRFGAPYDLAVEEEPAMTETLATCWICRDAISWDDIAVLGEHGRAICLRCFERETNTGHPMPAALRRQIIAAVNAPD